jgi:FAD/FMN-containing dehydrogenase
MSISEASSPLLEDASGSRGTADEIFAPSTTSELRAIVNRARQSHTPLTLRGSGTGLVGGAVPKGGWLIALDRFKNLQVENGRARCGVGLSLQDLQDAAAPSGQFLGPNPTDYSASIGGVISTNAGGARSFRFGALRYNTLALEATFMDGSTRWIESGERIDFPTRSVSHPATTKNSAGYFLEPDVEWVQLLCGSEGTLAIITQADLKLRPIPPAVVSGVVFFPSDENSLNAVDDWRVIPGLRLLEYMDNASLGLLRPTHTDIPSAARAALLVEQDLESEDDPELDVWVQRLNQHKGLANESWFGFSPADRQRFYKFRHSLARIVVDRARKSDFTKLATDLAVPISRNRELLAYYRRQCDRLLPGKYAIFGHIGDANTHLNLLPDTDDEAQVGQELMVDFAKFAVSLGGTVAAEHGIGKNKRDLLKLMYSSSEIDSMKDVKRRLDPDWLLNRGNVFDSPDPE